MIRINQLSRNFGSKIAVDRLSLEIQSGEICGFLGPNGAGKTTTLRMMVGLLRPTAGTVLYGDQGQALDIRHHSRQVRKQIGYIPDAPFLYEKLTGREHLRFVGEIYEVDRSLLDREIDHYLSLFSLTEQADQPIESYSHGMRQKIVFSAALLHHPRYLIVDEPMVGLDPRSARLVKDLFLNLSREYKTTLLLSTHSLDLAEEVCDRIGILSHGHLAALGTREELRALTKKKDSNLEEVFLALTGDDE
ncbi:MAG: ABC transporter ATP-binding protein [Candidatus Omnitrophica bacterium]|nr:MAG: putative ABC transporter ATP-binding protein YxlF [Candidatus Hinthialibacteria bacterium OLB16]MBE7488006.1 ABC transporter ATP-binding protein [bacterium]MCC6732713.1 ABC transporter ATP-binding protein [Candidatus Omnitrophota bacterium]MCE7909431.1 ABC transporter ATP-binding protein [Candidatus Omnitrophica bacterium COP1]MBV6482193.1 putative ABC transporter ATP-binding protein YxlF [bacterium]